MIELIKDYAEKRIDLIKLEATEKTVLTVGSLVSIVLLVVPIFFFIVMLNVGLGFLIGNYLHNYAYGFLILAGFYFLIFILFLLLKKSIKNYVANIILKAIS